MKLSPHFTLNEMIESNTAKRNGIANMPSTVHINNLDALCKNVLESVRAHYKKPWNKSWINVTSGYRCPALNKKIGGSRYSQHQKGEAADFRVNKQDIQKVWRWIVTESNINFDQCIMEFASWIHISFRRNNNNRNKITVALKKDGKTIYTHYSKDDIINNNFTRV